MFCDLLLKVREHFTLNVGRTCNSKNLTKPDFVKRSAFCLHEGETMSVFGSRFECLKCFMVHHTLPNKFSCVLVCCHKNFYHNSEFVDLHFSYSQCDMFLHIIEKRSSQGRYRPVFMMVCCALWILVRCNIVILKGHIKS